MEKIFFALRELSASGKNAVLVSVIASSGSTPRGTGAKMLVLEDGSIRGTIGGGAVEHRSIELAQQLHQTKQSVLRGFDLSNADKCDLGMICGGKATVYFQYLAAEDPQLSEMLSYEQTLRSQETDAWLITAITEGDCSRIGIYAEGSLHFLPGVDEAQIRPHLGARSALVSGEATLYIEPLVQSGRVYVFGGGHVAQALVPILSGVGFRCVVFDDRARFTSEEVFPDAARRITGDFSRITNYLTITEQDCVVIMTRGHEADYTVLEQALDTPAYYIGLIGSCSKMAATRKKLSEEGFGQEDFERIHNPIGLPILAETPAEIAISVAGEMILARAQRRREQA